MGLNGAVEPSGRIRGYFDVSLEPEEIGSMKSYEDIVRILKSKGVE